jgi:hypothetical protein
MVQVFNRFMIAAALALTAAGTLAALLHDDSSTPTGHASSLGYLEPDGSQWRFEAISVSGSTLLDTTAKRTDTEPVVRPGTGTLDVASLIAAMRAAVQGRHRNHAPDAATLAALKTANGHVQRTWPYDFVNVGTLPLELQSRGVYAIHFEAVGNLQPITTRGPQR